VEGAAAPAPAAPRPAGTPKPPEEKAPEAKPAEKPPEAAAKDEWKKYPVADGKFTAEAPGELKKGADRTANGVTTTAYTYRDAAGAKYEVNTVKYPELLDPTPATAKKVLQQQINAIAGRSGGKLGELREVTLGTYPGFEFEITGTRDGDAVGRMFQ